MIFVGRLQLVLHFVLEDAFQLGLEHAVGEGSLARVDFVVLDLPVVIAPEDERCLIALHLDEGPEEEVEFDLGEGLHEEEPLVCDQEHAVFESVLIEICEA